MRVRASCPPLLQDTTIGDYIVSLLLSLLVVWIWHSVMSMEEAVLYCRSGRRSRMSRTYSTVQYDTRATEDNGAVRTGR